MDKTKKIYKILRATNPITLEKEVNEYLGMGWELSGGIAVDGSYYQAVFRVRKEVFYPEPDNEVLLLKD